MGSLYNRAANRVKRTTVHFHAVIIGVLAARERVWVERFAGFGVKIRHNGPRGPDGLSEK